MSPWGCPIGGSLRPAPSPFRFSPASTSTAAPIPPAPSTSRSTPRSLTAAGSWLPRPLRTSRITNNVTITTSRTTPTTTASWCSGPSQRRVPTAPRSPASPATISSATGSTRTSQSCAVSPAEAPPRSAPRPGGIAPGWRLVIASRSWYDGRPTRTKPYPAPRTALPPARPVPGPRSAELLPPQWTDMQIRGEALGNYRTPAPGCKTWIPRACGSFGVSAGEA